MTAFVILWAHVVAAALYGALAVFQLRRWNGDPRNRPLLAAFAAMSVWTIFLALVGPYTLMAQLAESGRNLAFLAFMYGLMASAGGDQGKKALKGVFAAVAAVIGLQIVIGGVMPKFDHAPVVLEALATTSQIIGLTIAAGSLILVHNIYGLAAPDSRSALRFPMLALAVMWAIDLHLYTVDYFSRAPANELFAARGVVLALIAPLFALGLRNVVWRIQISRVATFQSISVIAILGYIVTMMLAARAIEIVGGDWARIGQVAVVLGMTLLALLILPSAKLRAWLRVTLAKHLFEHRYDYRQEWLRFTDTVGRGTEGGAMLEERVVKALADIGGAPGGLLLLVDEHRRLSPAGHWNWSGTLPASAGDGAEALLCLVEQGGYVVDFAAIRDGQLVEGGETVAVPAWLARMDSAWAGIPLSHEGRLAGLVILEHPALRRRLDWEDFDLFRTAGIQAASYIAEARSLQALADAQRFDEFNRRFAFILHDIKNLVSQLSLVTRNAERHADNPEFRADMIATLQSSVRKMNDLLARLSPGAAREADPPRAVEVQPILDAIAAARQRQHPVRAFAEAGLLAMADPAALEQALSHLVQNAIDASDPGIPVVLRANESGGDVAIEVIDRGAGMAAEFIRTRLFQPFASTKEQGFGVGAHEAKSLITAMGGRLEVESRLGNGTRFTLFLPGAESRAHPLLERKRA
ncbi:MAG TPA: XrtA/PEP-CTERM system histidine kinase PrsK [Allosphingosinicella sp.]|nr:XrtA/PEP-CTERM system histidine kinase PrsK [Allosphingosinicella sp.]